MARPGCGGGCNCLLANGTCTAVTGSGTAGDPFIISVDIAVGDNGLECGPSGAAVVPSTDAGNLLDFGTDGRLLVPDNSGVFGTMALQNADSVNITGGTIIGVPMVRNNQGGTTYTFQTSDSGKVVRATNAGASTFTLPLNASDAIPIDTVIAVYAAGAGGLTIDGAVGVTIRNNASALAQYDEVSLRKDGTDEWVRVG